MTSLNKYANNASGLIQTALAPTDTVISLTTAAAALFPAITLNQQFYATLTDAATQTVREVVLVTARVGTALTVTRGQDGTAALSWLVGDYLSQNVVAAELNDMATRAYDVPSGIICMWSGASTAIPTAWALCDGTNGTPNLEGQFVIGAGGAYAVGATGGAATTTLATANLPAHNHGITDSGHNHGITDSGHNHVVYRDTVSGTSGTSLNSNQGISNQGATTTTTSATGITINAAVTGITINNTGSGTAFSTLPPYYAICYIMKL